MEYLYGALLLHKAGQKITEDALEKTLAAAGIKVDKARVKATITALKDVDIKKVLSETQVAAAAPSAAPAPAAGGEKPTAEAKPKKEEPSEEDKAKSDEEAAAGLGALFG